MNTMSQQYRDVNGNGYTYSGINSAIFKFSSLLSKSQLVKVVVAVMLLFYVHGKHLRSYLDGLLT